MYFDEQDVVGESCGTQLDVDMMMAPLAASLPSFTIVSRPSFLMPLSGVAVSRIDSPTTMAGREDEDKEVEEALEKDDNEESDAVSSLRKLLWRDGPNEEGAAEPESPTARMAQMDAESLAVLSIVVPPSQQDAEATGLNANAMQRLHLQTPRKDDGDADGMHTDYDSFIEETPGTAVFKKERKNGNNKRPRSSASSPTSSSTSSSSTCASAVVLARKRALKESWRDRQMAVVPQQENSPVFDDEDDEQVPRITSFVEYHATDIDDLVIAPSQDYFDDAYDAEGENEDEDQAKAEEEEEEEEEEEDSANQSTQQQQMCGFVDFRDFTQLDEECSEVFDDVIYAPKPVQLPPRSMMPPIREDDRRSQSHSPPRSAVAEPLKSKSAAVEMKKENINSQADKEERDANNDSESSLSDGFDIPPMTKSNEAAIPKRPEPQLQPHTPPLPPPYQFQQQCKGQWNQRRSVKRDCTFIETQCASPVFEDDEDFEDDALPLSPHTGKCQRALAAPRIEELKADYIDSSSDDFEELPMKLGSITTTPTTTRSYNATGSSATASAARSPLRFQPRLLKKRRKAGQLGLEPFFRSRPCT